MRKIHRYGPGIALALLIVLPPLSGLVSCSSLANGPFSSNNAQTTIDWVDFIRFGGIIYVATPPEPGHSLVESDLGSVFAAVTFKLAGNVQDPEYQNKDGDAAFLDVGTKIYTVKGYHPTFRLAAYEENHTLTLYEADTNPQARKGADLLDIGGKVEYIGIASEENQTTELSTIKDPKQINTLVTLILEASVNQNHQTGNKQYLIVFHLADSPCQN